MKINRCRCGSIWVVTIRIGDIECLSCGQAIRGRDTAAEAATEWNAANREVRDAESL